MRVANAVILGAFVVLLIPALLIWNRSLIYVTGYGSAGVDGRFGCGSLRGCHEVHRQVMLTTGRGV